MAFLTPGKMSVQLFNLLVLSLGLNRSSDMEENEVRLKYDVATSTYQLKVLVSGTEKRIGEYTAGEILALLNTLTAPINLNVQKVGGLQASQFVRSDADDTITGILSSTKKITSKIWTGDITNNSTRDTGISDTDAGMLTVKNNTDNYAAVYLLSTLGAGTTKLAAGGEGIGFFWEGLMALRICVDAANGTYYIKNLTGATKNISYGYHSLD